MVNNQLAPEYASQPVVFIGYDANADNNLAPYRKSRFKAVDTTPQLPHLMVDSGQQIDRGGTTDQAYYYQKIKSMVNAELGRPPLAAVSARAKRVGNHYEVTVQVTNQSGVTLAAGQNGAAVHAVVYETFTNATRPPSLTLSNNYGRVTAYKSISQLANNATGTYTLVTPDLPGDVNWANLHVLAMVDYRPGGSSGPYDMLQAAFAQPDETTYTVSPSSLVFLINAKSPANQTKPLQISSNSPALTWSISESAGWLSVSPASGSAGTPASVTVSAGGLSPGTQTASLTIQLSGADGFSRTVSLPVTAYLGDIRQIYLPSVRR